MIRQGQRILTFVLFLFFILTLYGDALASAVVDDVHLSVDITDASGISYDGDITVTFNDDTTVVVACDPGLSDETCYTIEIHGDVQGSFFFGRLAGDVTQDGVVDSLDESTISGYYGQAVTEDTFLYDITRDNIINSEDTSALSYLSGNSLDTCIQEQSSTILTVLSEGDHNGLLYSVDITDNPIEPRMMTTTTLSITFSEPISPDLTIVAPSTAQEGQSFVIAALVHDIPQREVSITFDGTTYTTNERGQVTVQAPGVDQDNLYTITAAKQGYTGSQQEILIVDTSDPTIPHLEIQSPTQVDEKAQFTVTILHEDTQELVADVLVVFQEEEQYTSTVGTVQYTAPTVDVDTSVEITATKEGYYPTSTFITIKNQDEQQTGIIQGVVLNQEGTPLHRAQLCFSPQQQRVQTCIFSNETGGFTATLDADEYTITVTKLGYQPYIEQDVLVEPGEHLHFIITMDAVEHSSELSMDSSDYLIQYGILEGLISATVSSDGQVFHFDDADIDIIIVSSGDDGLVEATVSSTQDEPAVLVFELPPSSSDIVVTYDGDTLQEVTISQIYVQSKEGACYACVPGVDSTKILVGIPHFSTHTITIRQLVDLFTGPVGFTLYGVIVLVGIGAFYLPFVAWSTRKRQGK